MHTYQIAIEIHFQVGEAKLNYDFEGAKTFREAQPQEFNQTVIAKAREAIQEVLLQNSMNLDPTKTGAPLFVIIRVDGDAFFKIFFSSIMEAPLVWSDENLTLDYYAFNERQKLS
ncbi:MAG: hypothetical protein ACRCWD_03695 [Culicoidibacterales bacterium]